MNEFSHPQAWLPLRLLLLGYGHVAQAFLPLLAKRSEWLGTTYGITPIICGIGTRSQGYYLHSEGFPIATLANDRNALHYVRTQSQRVENAETFIRQGKENGASLLIELTTLNPLDGQPALQHIRTALENSMNVITANKGPLAYGQSELQSLAQRKHVQFRFEATVMDGFPLINMAEFTLQAVGMRSFRALLNTTSSYVLHRIEHGNTLDEAIHQAQQLGIAEADPWYDLDGWDAVMKTTILANNLLNGQLTPSQVKRTGLRNVSLEEIRTAASNGTPVRLVSSASSKNGVITAEVSPTRIGASDVLCLATGTTSIISMETEAMGSMTFIEHEPTVIQTAYGILSDLITMVRQHHTT